MNVIRCPVCRQECMEADVMENLFVNDAFEAPSSTMERCVQVNYKSHLFRLVGFISVIINRYYWEIIGLKVDNTLKQLSVIKS